MANFKSDTVVAQETAAANAGKIIADAPLISGKLHFIQGKLTVPAGTAIGDNFEIAKIPAGVTVIPGLCSIRGAGAGASTTLSLNFDGDFEIAAATAVSAAGTKQLAGNVGSFKNNTRRSLNALLAGGGMTEGVELYFNIACVVAE